MRPVNLIPPEDRRGDRAPLRAGSLSYVVVGTFAAALVAVVALVLTQNSITQHENDIAELEVARDDAAKRAEALAPYAQFATLQAQREQTITSLAQSRFDWERVLRELALVIPGDITLDSLDASTAGQGTDPAAVTTGVDSSPSLMMTGCGPSHESVAAFVAALEDIDGVTRVGLENSVRGGEAGGASTSTTVPDDTSAAVSCGKTSTSFAVTAVFDGVGTAAAAAAAPATAPPATTTEAAAPAETNSADEQVQESGDAANLVTGAVR